VAYDAYAAYAMMKPIECRVLELLEATANHSARSSQNAVEPKSEADIQAVRHQMATAKVPRIVNQLVNCQSNACIVCSDDRPGTRSDDDVNGYAMRNDLLKDSDVTGAPQAAAAENQPDPSSRIGNALT
jgi:hypothetical protein